MHMPGKVHRQHKPMHVFAATNTQVIMKTPKYQDILP